jgi:hypothetical protein
MVGADTHGTMCCDYVVWFFSLVLFVFFVGVDIQTAREVSFLTSERVRRGGGM